MVGKIYRKLYFWFLLVFILTIAVVSLLVHGFYTERVRDELQGQLEGHARFLLAEYQEACRVQGSRSCSDFLERLTRISPVRFWVTNPAGLVLFTNQQSGQPLLKRGDLAQAKNGETVISMRRRSPPYVIIPLKNSNGNVEQLAVIERGFVTGRRFPRFPVFASLIVALITIAILIFPLSMRLTRPVSELHRLGQDWAEGRLEKRAVVRGNDEISELAGTFNAMAENLQKMLEQRKEFLAWISHELKSPLARMRIALELLSEKTGGETETEKLLNHIRQEIAESEKLIEQLLVLSKVEMNAPFMKEPVALHQVTERAVKQVEPMARHADIDVVTSGAASITGDSYQLERAMINILENAVKFSNSGEKVRIEIHQADGFAYWKCIDRGSGIQEDEREKIFQPFYRGKGTNGKEGSGLGLFIAKRIVEMHGGSIHAEKSEPAGITIMIQLPL